MRPEWLKTSTYPGDVFTRLEIRQERVSGMELVLGAHTDWDIVSESHFEDCNLIIEVPKRVRFTYNRFDRCTFRPKKTIQCDWSENAWYDCTFFGKYVSTHFGQLVLWKDKNPWGDILVRGCDFSQATMHYCYFDRTDVPSIKFPKWPCFTALRPYTNAARWLPTLVSISPSFTTFFPVKDKDEADAAVFHWPTFARELKIDMPIDEVKSRLSSLDGILL